MAISISLIITVSSEYWQTIEIEKLKIKKREKKGGREEWMSEKRSG